MLETLKVYAHEHRIWRRRATLNVYRRLPVEGKEKCQETKRPIGEKKKMGKLRIRRLRDRHCPLDVSIGWTVIEQEWARGTKQRKD